MLICRCGLFSVNCNHQTCCILTIRSYKRNIQTQAEYLSPTISNTNHQTSKMLCKTILFSILSTLTLVAAQGSCPGDKPKSLCCYRKVNNVGEEFSTKDRSADGSLREDQTLEAKLKEHNLPNDTPSNAGCFTWEQCKTLRFKEKPYDVCCTDTYADPAMLNVTPDIPVVGLNCAQRVEEKPSAF